MGTRADFYVGRGTGAEWLGSTAWDGYPDGITPQILTAFDERTYRELVAEFIAAREDGTAPEAGWPWPWDDSNTTDYAYALDDGEVWVSSFGRPWFRAKEGEPESDDDAPYVRERQEFPDMSDRKNVAWSGPASGLIVIDGDGVR